MRVKVLGSVLLLGIWAMPSLGAISFSNPMTSEAGLASVLEEADSVTLENDIVYSAAGAQFGAVEVGNLGRNHIHSIVDDYSTVDFVAEVTADYSIGGRIFFGLGSGELGVYGTPDWEVYDSIWLELGPFGVSNTFIFDLGGIGPDGPYAAGIGLVGGEARVRMSYDSTAKTMTYEVDDSYAGGAMVVDYTVPAIDVSMLFTNGEAARVFVGGGTGSIVRDLDVTVVPEPATLALLGIGGLVALSRRRK